MIEALGRKYYLDLNKIFNFINYSETHKTIEREIIDSYEENEESNEQTRLNNVGKTIREVTTSGNTNMDNIKYDLLKNIINQVITCGCYEYPELSTNEDVPTGVAICLNTLIKEKMLIEI